MITWLTPGEARGALTDDKSTASLVGTIVDHTGTSLSPERQARRCTSLLSEVLLNCRRSLFAAKARKAMLQIRERERINHIGVDPAVALRGFFAIAQAWGLNTEDARALLGAPPERTFYA